MLQSSKQPTGLKIPAYPPASSIFTRQTNNNNNGLNPSVDISSTSIQFDNLRCEPSLTYRKTAANATLVEPFLKSKAKTYTKAIAKTDRTNSFTPSSSYSMPSRGRLVHEDLLSSEVKYLDSSSLSSTSSMESMRYTPTRLVSGRQQEPKMTGIKNLKYRASTTTMSSVKTPVAAETKFVNLSQRDGVSTRFSNENRYDKIVKAKDTTSSFTSSNRSISSKTYLSSLLPLNDLEMEAYNRRKIQERKKAIYEQWKEENKKIGRKKSASSHSVTSSST